MRCAHCEKGEMRLIRFHQRQEVFACQDCNAETLLLDCHYCERRTVRRLPELVEGVARWACHRCQVPQNKCPTCSNAWVLPNGVLEKPEPGFSCQQCDTQWLLEDKIGL